MSTANRTRAQMSFQQHWNGNPCAYVLAIVDGKRRPAVDPDRHGSGDFVT